MWSIILVALISDQYQLSQPSTQDTSMDEMISITYNNNRTHPFIYRHITTTIAVHPVVIPAGLIVPRVTTGQDPSLTRFWLRVGLECQGWFCRWMRGQFERSVVQGWRSVCSLKHLSSPFPFLHSISLSHLFRQNKQDLED